MSDEDTRDRIMSGELAPPPKDPYELARDLLCDHPELSNREIARRSGVSHPTVARIRVELEEAGQVDPITEVTDTLGRVQPVAGFDDAGVAATVRRIRALTAGSFPPDMSRGDQQKLLDALCRLDSWIAGARQLAGCDDEDEDPVDQIRAGLARLRVYLSAVEDAADQLQEDQDR